MSPKRDQVATNPPPENTPKSETDFSFYEMTADIHGKLGKLEEAVETLKKSVDKHSEKLDKLSTDVASGKTLLTTVAWIIPIAVAILTVLMQISFHFWK